MRHIAGKLALCLYAGFDPRHQRIDGTADLLQIARGGLHGHGCQIVGITSVKCALQ